MAVKITIAVEKTAKDRDLEEITALTKGDCAFFSSHFSSQEKSEKVLRR